MSGNDPGERGTDASSAVRQQPSGQRRGRLLVLLGLTGFAISQPLLAVLGDSPMVFSTFGVEGWTLVAFALAVVVVPPIALWLPVEAAFLVHRRLGELCFSVTIGLLAAAASIQLAKWAGIDSRYALQLIAVIGGFGLVSALRRFSLVSTWLHFLSPLPLLAFVLFLFVAPTSSLLQAGSTESPPEPSTTDAPPVVLLVLDELPTKSLLDGEDRIDPNRFPHLAELAGDAAWYRHYTAMSPFTGSALPSLLTGQFPAVAAPFVRNYPDSIFSLLAPTHDLTVYETATLICDEPACSPTAGRPVRLSGLVDTTLDVLEARLSLGVTRDVALDDFVESNLDVERELPALGDLLTGVQLTTVPDRAAEFIDSMGSGGERPAFHYLHVMLPHRPWLFYDDGGAYRHIDPFGRRLPPSDERHGDWWSDWSAAVTEQRHLLQATYTDAIIGAVIERLKAVGTYDESLIVVVSDHGVSFAPRQHTREPTSSTIGDVAYVPLLVKEPNQEAGRVDDSNLMSIDLLPTLASIVGVTPPWDTDGVPAGSAEIAERGDTKVWYDITEAFSPELLGTVEYSDAASFPAALDRHIGPIEAGDDPLQGLFDVLNVPDVLGRHVDDLNPEPGGSLHLANLADLEHPPPGEPPLGVVTGTIEGLPPGIEDNGIFVLAVNGVVVTGSQIDPDSSGALQVVALVPEGVLQPTNEIRAVVVTFLGAFELASTD